MTESPNKKRHQEQQFQDKLNQVVKLIKNKQQICLQIISYLQQIINSKESLEQLYFLQDQISKHKLFLQKINKKNDQCKQIEKKMLQSYSQSIQLNLVQRNLVKRVSARILQTFQFFNQKVEKYFHFQKQIFLHYKIVKSKLIKLINNIQKSESTSSNIFTLCSSFFDYLSNKFCDQCKKLYKIIQLIENGDIDKIQQAYICKHCKDLQSLIQKQIQKKPSNLKFDSKDNKKHNIADYESTYFSKQKQKIKQKLKQMRNQAKSRQIIKKKKTKFANKYYTLYQSAMDIHKGYFIEQLTFFDQKQQSERILQQISQRNKTNQGFIKQYIESMSQKNIEERKNFRVQSGRKVFDISLSDEEQNDLENNQKQKIIPLVSQNFKIDMKEQEQFNEIELSKKFENNDQKNQIKSFRITNPNRKTVIATPKSNPNLFAVKEPTQSFNFVKINMKNSLNQKSRLPDISNRLLSIDDRRKSVKTIDKQTFCPLRNNNLLVIKTNLSKNKSSKKQLYKKNNQEVKGKQQKSRFIKRSESGNKLQIERVNKISQIEKGNKKSQKTLQIKYSTSISKKLNKFCEIASTKSKQCVY